MVPIQANFLPRGLFERSVLIAQKVKEEAGERAEEG